MSVSQTTNTKVCVLILSFSTHTVRSEYMKLHEFPFCDFRRIFLDKGLVILPLSTY